MGYTYYKYHLFIPASNPLTFDEFTQFFRTHLVKGLAVSVESNRIVVKDGNWAMRIYWETEPHVLVESQEFATVTKLASDLAALLATCDRRITTAGDDDPGMDYFNDCVFVLEVLNRLENVLRLDLSGQFVNQFGDL